MSEHDPANPAPPDPGAAPRLIRDLTGDLFCLKCRYNLRGLSITERCPECGLPVKATLLAIVDPHADELTPIHHPRMTAIGLLAWPAGALLAVIVVWGLRIHEQIGTPGFPALPGWWVPLGVAGLIISGLGAVALIKPYGGHAGLTTLRNASVILAYIPATLAYWRIHAVIDAMLPTPYVMLDSEHLLRAGYRLAISAAFVWGILALRPTARSLAARSVIIREGRTDRQPLVALVGALAITGSGDLVHLLRPVLPAATQDLAMSLEIVLIALGSVFLTFGLANLVRDGIRLYPVIAAPPLGLADVLGHQSDGAEMNDAERNRFDALLQRVIDALPPQAADAVARVAIIVDDRPAREILQEFGIDPEEPGAFEELCGLHTGVMDTELEIEAGPVVPSQIHLFREGIVALAGGWDVPGAEKVVLEEIRITLLHEIGHQLGLDEGDLESLGYD